MDDDSAGAPREPDQTPAPKRSVVSVDPRFGRYVGLFALLLVVLFTINTIVSKPNGARGVAAGEDAPPFAVPLVTGSVQGDADVATRANEGAQGRVPACKERGPGILNMCQLYERAPVVLALFVYSGSCEAVLSDMQALARSFPGVDFAAVSIKGDRGALRRLVRRHALTFPVGIDRDGILARLYKLATCPQVSFVLRGGVVQSAALLNRPSRSQLRARVAELLAAARAPAQGGAK